jgi:hypothetical protein
MPLAFVDGPNRCSATRRPSGASWTANTSRTPNTSLARFSVVSIRQLGPTAR